MAVSDHSDMIRARQPELSLIVHGQRRPRRYAFGETRAGIEDADVAAGNSTERPAAISQPDGAVVVLHHGFGALSGNMVFEYDRRLIGPEQHDRRVHCDPQRAT